MSHSRPASSPRRVGRLLPLLVALMVVGQLIGWSAPAVATSAANQPAPDQWTQSAGDGGHNRFNPGETQLTPATIGGLRPAWTVDKASQYGSGAIVDGIGYLALAQPNANDPQPIVAVDAVTGVEKWRVDITTVQANRGLAVANGILYVFGDAAPHQDAGGVTAISLRTHQVLWTAYNSKSIFSWLSYAEVFDFAVDSGRLYLLGDSGNLDAYDAVTGRHLWTEFAQGDSGNVQPVHGPIAAAGGLIVYGDPGSSEVVHNGATNALVWTPAGNVGLMAPTAAAGRLYLVNNERVLSYPLAGCGAASCPSTWTTPLTLAGESFDWDVTVSGADASSLVVAADYHHYPAQGEIVVLNAGTGSRRWSAQPAVAPNGALAVQVARAGNVLYVLADYKLLGYDINCASTCTPVQIATIDGSTDFPNAQLSVADGSVLVNRQQPQETIAYRAPAGPPARTSAYIAGSRVGAAVYVNGLVTRSSPAGSLRSAGRPVYLQRYLNGAWQNLLVRTTDQLGRIAVGFSQPHPFVYRLVVPAVVGATSAVSAPLIR